MLGWLKKRSDLVWTADMWYRFVVYREGSNLVSLQVDVMAEGSDVVFVPSAASWQNTAPAFVRERRESVFQRLKSIEWNRQLDWEESDLAECLTHDPQAGPLVPGCIESTPGGRFIEEQQFFQPGSPMSFTDVRHVWKEAERKVAAQASGHVRLSVANAKPNSMFIMVSLPALKTNPNVTLDYT